MTENPMLYEVAKQICHDANFPWTDPRTGKTYQPPNAQEQSWRKTLNSFPICMIDKFDESEIDKGILPLVLMLRLDDFQTISSCEGGKLCCSGHPYVMLLPDIGSTSELTIKRLDDWLQKNGITEYSLHLRITRSNKISHYDKIPMISIEFPQFDPPPFHKNEFSHEQYDHSPRI